MAFRTIVIESRCKLEYSLNNLVCRKGNDETRILLDEIKTIIINSGQVSITTGLISEIIKKNVKLIFTDGEHNPSGEIVPYYNNFYSYRKIKEQISFCKEDCDYLWKEIIREKIHNQAKNLKHKNNSESYDLLLQYRNCVLDGDPSNREGHAAKVYFNSLFGKDFSRNQKNDINMLLNYGYSIILSTINREVKALGYLTELGIHHIGESNQFNLSCDLMEPIRPLVDLYVINGLVCSNNFKEVFVKMLTKTVLYNNREILLENAIRLYVEDMFGFLKTKDINKIRFIKYEL